MDCIPFDKGLECCKSTQQKKNEGIELKILSSPTTFYLASYPFFHVAEITLCLST